MVIGTFDSHHESEHFVVGASGEHDVTCEQLVQTHSHRPEVDGTIVCAVLHEEKDMRRVIGLMEETCCDGWWVEREKIRVSAHISEHQLKNEYARNKQKPPRKMLGLAYMEVLK